MRSHNLSSITDGEMKTEEETRLWPPGSDLMKCSHDGPKNSPLSQAVNLSHLLWMPETTRRQTALETFHLKPSAPQCKSLLVMLAGSSLMTIFSTNTARALDLFKYATKRQLQIAEFSARSHYRARLQVCQY
jgi:hypothetical protein